MSEFPRHPTRRQLERSQAIGQVIHGLVDTVTAHEGRLDAPQGSVMGFTPYGEFDIQYQPQLPIMDVAEPPLVPQEFDWEGYMRGISG